MPVYVGMAAFAALALFGFVAGVVSRALAKRGRNPVAIKLGTAGFCAMVAATVLAGAFAYKRPAPLCVAVAALLLLLSLRNYLFLEKLPWEIPATEQPADGPAEPPEGGN